MNWLLAFLKVIPAVLEFWAKLAVSERRRQYKETHDEVDEDLVAFLERRYGRVRVTRGADRAEGSVSGEKTDGDTDH